MLTRGRSQQAQQQGASPGPGSQLGVLLQGLALEDRTAVTWEVALKPPQSTGVVVTGGSGEWREAGADEWLASKLLHQGWIGWVAYNDEPPEGSAAASGAKFGHCKGVLAWSKGRLGWLVHSVPGWPAHLSEDSLPSLAARKARNNDGLRCGQSFLWLSLARTDDLTRRICDQVRLMDACIYAGRVTPDEEGRVGFQEDRFGEHLPRPYRLVAPSLVALGPGCWHLAKDATWGHIRVDGRPMDQDFFEDALARTEPFAGFWHVQSWLNGNVRRFGTTPHCNNILQLRLPDGAPFQTTSDHSKWGVHRDKPFVVVGDLNRTSAQAKRGGGGVVIRDEGLWRALSSLVHLLGDDHPPPPRPLASYDEFHAPGGLGGGHSRASVGRLLRGIGARLGLAPRGGRGVGTAAGPAPSDTPGAAAAGTDGDAASSASQAANSASKGCQCKTGCSHSRCGCRRAGRPCTARCGCGGQCAHSAAAAGAEVSSAATCGQIAEAGGAADRLQTLAAAEAAAAASGGVMLAPVAAQAAAGGVEETGAASAAPPQMPPPEEAAAAVGAALASLAAARAAAVAAAAAAPTLRQQAGQPPEAGGAVTTAGAAAAEAGEQPPPSPGASTAETRGSNAGAPDDTCGSPSASITQQADGEERCHCRKGCRDRRCPCRKAGRSCGPRCGCRDCAN